MATCTRVMHERGCVAHRSVPCEAVVKSCTESDMLSSSGSRCRALDHASGCTAVPLPLLPPNHDVIGATSAAVGCRGHPSARLSLVSTAACRHHACAVRVARRMMLSV